MRTPGAHSKNGVLKTKIERFRAGQSFQELVNDFINLSTQKYVTRDKSKMYRNLILHGMLRNCPVNMIERVKDELEKFS